MVEFALFDVGAQRIGVPSHNVVQAIAYPQQISRLPRAKQALVGVFVHRAQVLPLLDLRHWMEAAEPQGHGTAEQQVLVLKADGHMFAVVIDALRGLLRVGASDVQKIHHDDDVQECFHSVVHAPDEQGLISVLDPLRLARQAQVWAAGNQPMAQTEGQDAGANAAAAPTQTDTCAVVRLDNTLLALPAAVVGEVLSDIPVQKVAGVGSHFLGMAQWRGREVPLLDLARVLCLPPTPQRSAPWLLILIQEERSLAFHVHDICAVRSFDAATLQRDATVSDAMRSFCLGSSLLPAGERVYLLDACALLDASPLSNRAQASVAHSGALRLGYQSHSRDEALVVFRSRQLWAASMDQMREIVQLPEAVRASFVNDSVLPISMEWRDGAVPLVDLRKTLDGKPSSVSNQARIIIAQCAAKTVGLLVESVDALIPGHASSRLRFVSRGEPVEMVTVGGTSGPQSSYQLMDLGQLPVFSASAAGAPAAI